MDDASAVRINGDGCKVARNRFSLCDRECIRITGITSLVEQNRADRISARLVNVTGGDNAIVRNNRASLVVGGINVDGDNVQVLSNRVSDCGGTAAISVNGDNVAVSQNYVNQTWNDADGVAVDSRTPTGGGTVQGNRITDAAGVGLRLDSVNNLIITSNRIMSSTEDNRAAFRLVGDTNTVTDCVVTDADNVGFLIEGNTNSLTDCTVTGATEVGFLINGGSNNALTDCRSSDCGLEGLDNQGFLTRLTRGRYRGARYDITNDVLNLATFTDPSLAGVNFETGGSTQQSQF
jgi:parallel beta-helix repeat protein